MVAYNLNANEQLEIVRHWSTKITNRFANKTHHFWFAEFTTGKKYKWYKCPTWDEVEIFIYEYNIDDRRYLWLKEQLK